MGVPLVIILIFSGIFPFTKTIQLWGTPMTSWKPPSGGEIISSSFFDWISQWSYLSMGF